MKAQCASLLLAAAALAGCGEQATTGERSQGSTTPPYVRPEPDRSLPGGGVTPVRVGELGPSFAACNARGTTRDRTGSGPVPVRAAPFESADAIDELQAGSDFFICSRSHDQRWFGIVYDEGGRAAERCNVTSPLPERRDYAGPCAAGWVPGVRIRLMSGVPHQMEALVPVPPND